LDVLQAVADDELRTALELIDEVRDLAEVVRQIRVDHDDVIALRSVEACEIRAAVSTARLEDDVRAGRACEVAAAVARAVVDDDHLPVETAFLEHGTRASHAFRDRLRFVETGDDDGRTCAGGRAFAAEGLL